MGHAIANDLIKDAVIDGILQFEIGFIHFLKINLQIHLELVCGLFFLCVDAMNPAEDQLVQLNNKHLLSLIWPGIN
jgi:hypothetical protein